MYCLIPYDWKKSRLIYKRCESWKVTSLIFVISNAKSRFLFLLYKFSSCLANTKFSDLASHLVCCYRLFLFLCNSRIQFRISMCWSRTSVEELHLLKTISSSEARTDFGIWPFFIPLNVTFLILKSSKWRVFKWHLIICTLMESSRGTYISLL